MLLSSINASPEDGGNYDNTSCKNQFLSCFPYLLVALLYKGMFLLHACGLRAHLRRTPVWISRQQPLRQCAVLRALLAFAFVSRLALRIGNRESSDVLKSTDRHFRIERSMTYATQNAETCRGYRARHDRGSILTCLACPMDRSEDAFENCRRGLTARIC